MPLPRAAVRTRIPECRELQAQAVATIVSGIATVTAFARGTDTPTAPPTDTATIPPTSSATITPPTTPIPTDEDTPTPAPTWTARAVVVTATPAPRWRAWLPMLIVRRPAR